ncbi:MAG: SDR family oxidoreductase [Oscillospiraceae bacterium]|nr:SDR family oxidoreductase [Oscillospiraceae bacterium]
MEQKALLLLGADSDIGLAFLKEWEGPVIAHVCKKAELVDSCETSADIRKVFGDFSTKEGIEAFISEVLAMDTEVGKILFLPSIPAVPTKFAKITEDQLEKTFLVGYHAAFRVFQTFLPKMAKSGGGQVAAILTSYCFGAPPKFLAQYVSSKYALYGLVRSLAVEYASKGITVNAIAPSMVETSFVSNLPAFTVEQEAQKSPLGRNAKPEDLVPVLKLLLSGEAPYLNGAVIPVTSGSQLN